MTSSVSTDKVASSLLLEIWDHDPAVNTAKVTSADGGTTEKWVDMRDYDWFACAAVQTVLGGTGIVLLEIVASDSEDETDGSVTVIKTSGAVTANALAEWIFLECTAEEIAHAASTYALRYVAARITTQHAGDEAIVVYLAGPKRPHDAMIAPTNYL